MIYDLLYGVPVVAPASGQVVVAQDGAPDEVPSELSMNIAIPEANHMVVQHQAPLRIVISNR
jgi:hypothetical protein